MKNYSIRFAVLVISAFSALQIQAQYTSPTGRQDNRGADMNTDTRMREMRGLTKTRESEATPNKTKTTDAKLKIDKAELAKHESFLKTPQTGIFNLLPAVPDCPETAAKSERKLCEEEKRSVEYFANSYSFREKKNSPLLRADLSLAGSLFETGKSSVQSIIVQLGDVPLESLTLESEGVSYLAQYKPEQEIAKVNAQFEQMKNGVKVDGKYTYSKSSPVKENTTYALRSIAYYGDGIAQTGKNADVTIVFRVVKRNDDGTLTVLWKELDRKEATKLKM